jgi:hypothetical protein
MTIYQPDGPVLSFFLEDDAPVTIIQGPIRSGTSVCCAMKLFSMALRQNQGQDGVRRSKMAVIRSTYQQLQDTTLATWTQWFREDVYGRVIRSKPMRHVVRQQLGPDDAVEMEVIFLALDDEDDRERLMSFELTAAWVNELQFVPKPIFDELKSRCGHYPAKKDGGSRWAHVIADMNAPEEGHWVPYMRGDVPLPDWMTEEEQREYERPRDWHFYVQPPGLLEVLDEKGHVSDYKPNPDAENTKWLNAGAEFYVKEAQGKPKTWIDTRIMNRVGMRRDGKPVFPMYRRETHRAEKRIPLAEGQTLYVGVDFGRSPAAVMGQVVRGRWYVVAEYIQNNMGATTFAPLLNQEIARLIAGYEEIPVSVWGDPAGDFKGQEGETTPYMVFRRKNPRGGYEFPFLASIRAAPSNALSVRLGAGENVLNRMVDGKPGILVSPNCPALNAALEGAYHFRKVRGAESTRYTEEPEKDSASHVADAFQYMLLGGGEGRELVGARKDGAGHVNVRGQWSVFGGGREVFRQRRGPSVRGW